MPTPPAAHDRMDGPTDVRTDSERAPGPLHVVEFIDGLGVGGAQSLMLMRARSARKMGYRIDVVCLGEKDALAAEFLEHIDAVHRFPSQNVFKASRIVQIVALLRRLKPDVIHTHLRTSNIVGALCGKLAGIPVVTTLHSVFPGLGLEHARRDWAEKWALRLGARHVIAVGPGVARTQAWRVGGTALTTIPNPVGIPDDGIDLESRKARALDVLDLPFDTADTSVVLMVGRLARIKGVSDAIKVMQRFARSPHNTSRVKLLIAGDGVLHDELTQQVEASGLTESVFLLGRSERVRELMAASDVLLQSSYTEGLPLVLLEAMSMHLPIVATGVGDVPWLLGDGEFGALIEPGDIDGIETSLANLLDMSEAARRERAERAYRRAVDVFSLEGWLLEIDRVLRRAADMDRPVDRATSGSPMS